LHFGIDISCVAGTGSGKNIAFQATCLLNKEKIGIIICSLIALMKDQVCLTTGMMVISNSVQARSLELLGIKAITLTDETLAQTPNIFQKIENGNYSLVYISPERTLAKDDPFWQLLGRIKGKIYYVVDECHLVVDWGSSFRPDYANIASLRGHVGKVPFAALTATATREKRQIMSLPRSMFKSAA
jgi:ATP-dependent DNA helicase RecQ